MMPLGDDDSDYYASVHASRSRRSVSTPTTPVGGSSVRRVLSQRRLSSDITTLSKQLRRVHFSENALESTQHTLSTHHPTPYEAKQVIHNTSSRRLSIDEVELYFSECTKFPPASDDFVVTKFLKRNDMIIAGALEVIEFLGPKNLFSKSKTHWVELYNGVMLLHKVKDVVDTNPVKLFIAGCRLRILDMREYTMEIEYVFQQKKNFKLVKCQSKADLFLWWWALQLASVHKAGAMKQSFMSPLQLVEISNKVENVLFPRPSRTGSSRRINDRPSVTHLILVRHGEAENMHFRVADKEKGLTKRGREQAAAAAEHIAAMLKKAGAGEENVQLVFGGLQRTFETAQEFERAMPWLKQTNECCLLEEGAPRSVDHTHRMDFRAAMHRTAFECLCRHDPTEPQRPSANNTNENFKILICHTSFVQHCIAQSYNISKDVVKIGAPIGHCSITQIDVVKPIDKPEFMEVTYTNRVQHLRLTHRTSE